MLQRCVVSRHTWLTHLGAVMHLVALKGALFNILFLNLLILMILAALMKLFYVPIRFLLFVIFLNFFLKCFHSYQEGCVFAWYAQCLLLSLPHNKLMLSFSGFVWAHHTNGETYVFKSANSEAIVLQEIMNFTCISCNSHNLWALNLDGEIKIRVDVTASCPEGKQWIDLDLSQLGMKTSFPNILFGVFFKVHLRKH